MTGPYRSPPPPRDQGTPPAPRCDREEVIVHTLIAVVGAIGVGTAAAARDLHLGFTLALILVVIGIRGALRALRSPEA